MIIPFLSDFETWANDAIKPLSIFGFINQTPVNDEWQRWVQETIALPEIAKYSPPDPQTYASWVDWVHCFNTVVEY